jgi:hypothetical protein
VEREKVVSRERDVERRREVWEWEGWVYAHAEMGAPSMFRFLPASTILASHPPSPIYILLFSLVGGLETQFSKQLAVWC